MTKRKVISLIGIILTVFLIGNMFLPFVTSRGESVSLWGSYDSVGQLVLAIMMVVELVFAFLSFLMQLCGLIEHCKFVYFTLGFYLSLMLAWFEQFIEHDVLEYVGIGFWLGLGVSIILFILVFISGFLKNEKKAKRVPIRYDTKTGEPIYE